MKGNGNKVAVSLATLEEGELLRNADREIERAIADCIGREFLGKCRVVTIVIGVKPEHLPDGKMFIKFTSGFDLKIPKKTGGETFGFVKNGDVEIICPANQLDLEEYLRHLADTGAVSDEEEEQKQEQEAVNVNIVAFKEGISNGS